MRAGELMTVALRSELEQQARRVKKRLRRTARSEPEAVHDARTSLRRLREGLRVMGRTVFDPEPVAKLAGGLRDLERALGPARDDDVFLADFDAWAARCQAAGPAVPEGLRSWIRAQRQEHGRALKRELERPRSRRAVRRLLRWLAGPPRDVASAPKNPARAVPSLVRHFVPQVTWQAYQEVLAFELRRPAGLDVIHQVRSACRRLRYVLELFRDAMAPGVDDLIASLRDLQGRLGELHDHAVAVDRLELAISSGKLAAGPQAQAYLAHRRDERDRLQSEFPSEWDALSGQRIRFALSHLVSGEMGHERANGAVALEAHAQSAA